MLSFAPNVVLTVPDHPARSDLMAHFDEGYLEKSYGVPPPTTTTKTTAVAVAAAASGLPRFGRPEKVFYSRCISILSPLPSPLLFLPRGVRSLRRRRRRLLRWRCRRWLLPLLVARVYVCARTGRPTCESTKGAWLATGVALLWPGRVREGGGKHHDCRGKHS